jgi:hypothetical protein
MYNLANSIVEEGKQEQEALIANINTMAYLLRDALDQLPVSHPMRSDLLNTLVSALLVRFWHGGHLQDLDDAVTLRSEAHKLHASGLGVLTGIDGEDRLLVRS